MCYLALCCVLLDDYEKLWGMSRRTVVVNDHKPCTVCKQVKHVSEFQQRTRGGYYQSYCRACGTARGHKRWEAIKADRHLHSTYCGQIRSAHRQYRLRRAFAGDPVYIPMQKRLEAIMQLI